MLIRLSGQSNIERVTHPQALEFLAANVCDTQLRTATEALPNVHSVVSHCHRNRGDYSGTRTTLRSSKLELRDYVVVCSSKRRPSLFLSSVTVHGSRALHRIERAPSPPRSSGHHQINKLLLAFLLGTSAAVTVMKIEASLGSRQIRCCVRVGELHGHGESYDESDVCYNAVIVQNKLICLQSVEYYDMVLLFSRRSLSLCFEGLLN